MSRIPARDGIGRLAGRAGLMADWVDAHGRPQEVDRDTLRVLLASMGLRADSEANVRDSLRELDRDQAEGDRRFRTATTGGSILLDVDCAGPCLLEGEDGRRVPARARPDAGARGALLDAPEQPGYYTVHLANGRPMMLAVAPSGPRPFGPLAGKARAWGLAAQLYSLRREEADPARRTLGHGDFGAARVLAARAASEGADVLALSPVHAMFSAQPELCSPYAPSNRLLLNVLYSDPADALGESFVAATLAGLPTHAWAALDRRGLIDWRRSGRARMTLLRALHERFLRHPPAGLPSRLALFRRQAGAPLARHALFETLHGAMRPRDGVAAPWTAWDAEARRADAPALRAFADDHARELDFHCFAQWLAHESLSRLQADARSAGMRVGILADLAVGGSPWGSECWSRPDDYLPGVSIGAPPDLHNADGQCWNLAAASPRAWRIGGYAPFIALLRAGLARTGGLRIDHALGLSRMWLVPEGATPGKGAYLRYPEETLFRLAELEAWRRDALLVGEDLGTVPPGFGQRMRAHGMAGMNVLWFMRATDGAFLTPDAWPADAVAMPSTHDLPTMAGWWRGCDLAWQRRIGGGQSGAHAQRSQDRQALWRALRPQAAAAPPRQVPLPELLAHVASAPCALALVGLEDLQGQTEQANLPGTTVEHPNWRRRMRGSVPACFDEPVFRQGLDALKRARGRP